MILALVRAAVALFPLAWLGPVPEPFILPDGIEVQGYF